MLVSRVRLVTLAIVHRRPLAHRVLSTPTAAMGRPTVHPVQLASSPLILAIPFAAAVGPGKCHKTVRVSVAPLVAMPGLERPTVRSAALARTLVSRDSRAALRVQWERHRQPLAPPALRTAPLVCRALLLQSVVHRHASRARLAITPTALLHRRVYRALSTATVAMAQPRV